MTAPVAEWAILASLLTACSGEPVAVRVLASPEHYDVAVEGVVHISETAGVDLSIVDCHAPLSIVVGDVGHPGLGLVVRGCERVAIASPGVLVVAHEIGHMLGLEHQAGTLMEAAGPVADGLDDEQVETAQDEAMRLARCRTN